MASTILALLLLLIATPLALASAAVDVAMDVAPKNKKMDFDFFYLVLMWPGAYCRQSYCCKPSNAGAPPPADDFFVSSLIPYSIKSDSEATFCSNTNFYVDQIRDLPGLFEYWSSIRCPNGGSKAYWRSIWKKYGICATANETDYFSTALRLRAEADPLKLLAARGIEPQSFVLYSLDMVKAAIADGLGVTPAIRCSSTGKPGQFQLYQIYLCVDKNGENFIDCPVYPRFTCSPLVSFPPFSYNPKPSIPAAMIRMPVDEADDQ